MANVIFHIDLNCFFASAEILRNSALQHQKVAVSGLSRRSVITTASYEARAYGVKSAMPLHEALRLCPDLVVVQGDHDWYKQVSKKFFNFLRRYSNMIEPASIDEGYMDVSEVIKGYKRPLDLAWKIQSELLEELNLPCSIGVGPNKFLAKMASDMRKPLGIIVLRKNEIANKLWPLPMSSMPGVGKKTQARLEKMGIVTIGDIADPKHETNIIQVLGKMGHVIIQHAKGEGSDVVECTHSVQSISQSTTLDNDISEYGEIKAVFQKLAISLAQRAQHKHLKGSLISMSIRYSDFSNIMRSVSIKEYTDDPSVILEQALLLFDSTYSGDMIRHLGVGLGSLMSKERMIEQLNLFDTKKIKEDSLSEIIDQLNNQIPKANFKTAAQLLEEGKDHE